MKRDFLYWYEARVTESHWRHPVYDGDSIRCDIDMGFSFWRINEPVRLLGVDAPELPTKAGVRARAFVRGLLAPGDAILLRTYKDRTEKYGRYLADIFLADGQHLNQLLVDTGHAKPYE